MISNLIRTIFLTIKSFFKRESILVTEEISIQRINTCKKCVYLTGTNIVNYKCKLCKCFLNSICNIIMGLVTQYFYGGVRYKIWTTFFAVWTFRPTNWGILVIGSNLIEWLLQSVYLGLQCKHCAIIEKIRAREVSKLWPVDLKSKGVI